MNYLFEKCDFTDILLERKFNLISQFILFYCCAGEGYIVAFIRVLIIYQIFHTWIHSLQHSPLFPSPPIWEIVSAGIFFLFTFMCAQYLHHAHPPTSFPTSSPSHWYQPPQDLFTLLFSDFKKRKRNDIFACLKESYTGNSCGTCIFICIIARFGSSPPFFFFLL
jgi:hypothetical protein